MFDWFRQMARVRIEAFIRNAEDSRSSSSTATPADYVAIAAQSIAASANRLKNQKARNLFTIGEPTIAKKHKEIVDMLAHATIVRAEPRCPPSPFGHESFRLKLRNTHTGRETKALFKPRVWYVLVQNYMAFL